MKANRFVQEEKLQKKLEKEGKKETELGAFTKEAMAMKQRAQTTLGLESYGMWKYPSRGQVNPLRSLMKK